MSVPCIRCGRPVTALSEPRCTCTVDELSAHLAEMLRSNRAPDNTHSILALADEVLDDYQYEPAVTARVHRLAAWVRSALPSGISQHETPRVLSVYRTEGGNLRRYVSCRVDVLDEPDAVRRLCRELLAACDEAER